MKKLLVAALAAGVSCGLFAQEAECGENEGLPLEFGVDVDLMSAYVWRNAVQFNRPVAQVCPWADYTVADLFRIGGYVWQNYDLNHDRRVDGLRGEWNEADFNVHVASDVWTSDGEDFSLTVEFGHEWYVYKAYGTDEDDVRKRKYYPSSCEAYVSAEFANPLVTPYAKAAVEYKVVDTLSVETGLRKASTVADLTGGEADWMSAVSLFGDLNVSFGNRRCLEYLYGNVRDGELNEPNHGIGGLTAKAGVAWRATEWLTVRGLVAYTSVIDGTCRRNVRDGELPGYLREDDLVWGGFQVAVAF